MMGNTKGERRDSEKKGAWFTVGVILFMMIAAGSVSSQATSQQDFGTPLINNERVVVWQVTLAPGQSLSTTPLENDSVIWFMAGGKIRTTLADGRTSVASREPGNAVYVHKGAREVEQVISHAPMHLFLLELKNASAPAYVNSGHYPAAFPRPGSIRILENNRVIVWNYTFRPGVRTRMHFHDKDAVVAFRYNGSIESTTPDGKSTVSDHKAGTIDFSKGGRMHSEELVKGQETVVVLELK